MKKLFAGFMAAIMLLAISVTGFAADGNVGAITIENINGGAVYKIYQLLDLKSFDVAAGKYSYRVNSTWKDFFDTAEAKEYVKVDEAGYVTWISDEDDSAAFAQLALAYAKGNSIAPEKASDNEGDMTIDASKDSTNGTFSNLELGWYLVESNVGALCNLTTTKETALINDKNGVPTLEKKVQEDSTLEWQDENTADIWQEVLYKATINAEDGAKNYVFHDVMGDGLVFNKVSKIEYIPAAGTASELVENQDYTIVAATDGCNLEISFSKALCDKLGSGDKIEVFYQALLDKDAVIAGDGNINEAWLEYGDKHYTTHDITKTYTYGLDIVKTDAQDNLIDGAEFKIYDAATGGNEVRVVLMDDGVTYRRARADETGVSIVVKNGQVRLVGFDSDTYYLEETVAPEGYNKLVARQSFTISNANLYADIEQGSVPDIVGGVQVVNKTGLELPGTGGTGTALFVVFGGILVLGAGVLLFAKRRMAQLGE